MPNIGLPEILIVLVIALIVFGPRRLPEMGRSLGRGIREFKDSLTGKDDDDVPDEIGRSSDDGAPALEGEVVHERKS
jgi:sec-independent protein translocase protein TatA